MMTYTKPEIKAVELVIAEDIASTMDWNTTSGIIEGEANIGVFSQSFSSLQASV